MANVKSTSNGGGGFRTIIMACIGVGSINLEIHRGSSNFEGGNNKNCTEH
jgi:hypothetical protein